MTNGVTIIEIAGRFIFADDISFGLTGTERISCNGPFSKWQLIQAIALFHLGNSSGSQMMPYLITSAIQHETPLVAYLAPADQLKQSRLMDAPIRFCLGDD